MIKVVLDTNIFLSAFLFNGNSRIIFYLILTDKLRLCVSPKLKNEVLNKMRKYKATTQIANELIYFLHERSTKIEPKIKLYVCRDPKDNFLLELADTAKANYLISRDKDLLSLPKRILKTTKIVTPETFFSLLRVKKLI